MSKTAVDWLAEKYNYVTWMRNRDEISAGLADEWRKHYLEQAKEMEKQQTVESYSNGWHDGQDVIIKQVSHVDKGGDIAGENYYNETYGIAVK